MKMNKTFTALALGVAAATFSITGLAQDTIKVGVLHSLSGTMAISETTLKDTVLMMVEEQNRKGGLLGKKLEAVVVDPASDWPLFAEKARELITQEGVDVICGSVLCTWQRKLMPLASACSRNSISICAMSSGKLMRLR